MERKYFKNCTAWLVKKGLRVLGIHDSFQQLEIGSLSHPCMLVQVTHSQYSKGGTTILAGYLGVESTVTLQFHNIS